MRRRLLGILLAGLGIVPLLLLTACRSLSGPDEAYQERGEKEPWYTFLRPAKDDPAAQLDYARSLAAEGHARRAGRQYRALAASWPASAEAPVAQRERAEMLDRRGSISAAFEAYETLARRYPEQVPYGEIVDRQFDLALRQMDRRKWPLLFGGFRSVADAVPMLRKIVDHAPRGEHASRALLLMARAHEEGGDWEDAAQVHGEILSAHPSSPEAEAAAYGRANSMARLSAAAPNDMLLAQDAWMASAAALREHPDSPLAETARLQRAAAYRRLAFTAYEKALYYDRTARRYDAARLSYETFLKNYPDSEWGDEVRRRLAALPPEKGPDEAVAN